MCILVFLLILLPVSASAACLPIDQARNHLGETQCVTGKVIRVEVGDEGVRYLDFCEDYRLCPFSVVVFAHDMKNVGDISQLVGKLIQIRGELEEYDDRAEIVLESRKQLSGEAAGIRPLPKNFDVEQHGHFSAGQFRAKRSRSTTRKRGRPTIPREIPEDVESD